MKAKIFTFIILLSFTEIYAQQTGWVWQNPLPHGNDYNNIYFINLLTGYAVTSAGTLEKTTDGCLSWQHYITQDNVSVNECIFLNSSTGYIIGKNLKFLKTTDGGLTYINLSLPGNSGQELTSIQFLNSNNWFITTGGVGALPWGVFKTTDSGQNWTFSNLGAVSVESVFFTDSLIGFLLAYDLSSSYIKKTTNGGDTWVTNFSITGGGYPNISMSIKFFNSNTGYALKGKLYKTTNSGLNWSQVIIPSQFNDIYSFNFLNSDTGFILNNPHLYPSFFSVARTTNGGINWDTSQVYSNLDLSIVSFFDYYNGYLMGNAGNLFKTINSGINWEKLSSGFVNVVNSVQFTSIDTGYICGWGKLAAKTTNSGINWTQFTYSKFPQDLGKVYFLNNQTGFIIGATKNIFKTIDGGINWDSIYIPLTSNGVYGICFTDLNTGYLSGVADIFKSTNSGLNWSNVLHTSVVYLGDIKFVNANTGFVCVGFGPQLMKTTDAGFNWMTINIENASLRSIHFINSETGYVAGKQGLIFKTINTGLNWMSLNSSVTSNLNNIMFTDQYTGYAVGDNGTIIKTTNSGNTWLKLSSYSNRQLLSLYFINNNTGYITGVSGNILKTTTGGSLIGINKIWEYNPESFFLTQNYPNPFNPSTKIRFDIPPSLQGEGGRGVRVIVYDILGREVTTLVNEKLKPGSYEVSWDATNYPSGIYFYKLIMDEYIEAKKMILIK